MSKPKKESAPRKVSEANDGDIVRTPVGDLMVAWKYEDGRLPFVRLVDADLHSVGGPFHLLRDQPVQRVLRSQSSFAGSAKGGEVDPLRGGA